MRDWAIQQREERQQRRQQRGLSIPALRPAFSADQSGTANWAAAIAVAGTTPENDRELPPVPILCTAGLDSAAAASPSAPLSLAAAAASAAAAAAASTPSQRPTPPTGASTPTQSPASTPISSSPSLFETATPTESSGSRPRSGGSGRRAPILRQASMPVDGPGVQRSRSRSPGRGDGPASHSSHAIASAIDAVAATAARK